MCCKHLYWDNNTTKCFQLFAYKHYRLFFDLESVWVMKLLWNVGIAKKYFVRKWAIALLLRKHACNTIKYAINMICHILQSKHSMYHRATYFIKKICIKRTLSTIIKCGEAHYLYSLNLKSQNASVCKSYIWSWTTGVDFDVSSARALSVTSLLHVHTVQQNQHSPDERLLFTSFN